jgi:hypothetical protein
VQSVFFGDGTFQAYLLLVSKTSLARELRVCTEYTVLYGKFRRCHDKLFEEYGEAVQRAVGCTCKHSDWLSGRVTHDIPPETSDVWKRHRQILLTSVQYVYQYAYLLVS